MHNYAFVHAAEEMSEINDFMVKKMDLSLSLSHTLRIQMNSSTPSKNTEALKWQLHPVHVPFHLRNFPRPSIEHEQSNEWTNTRWYAYDRYMHLSKQ